MNPHFKQIVKDLGYQVNITLLEEQLEDIMFAVVRECADVAADHDALDIYEEIREHFGVEND